MKVGIVTASISRQAGGLFWSVRALAQGVKLACCEVQVFSNADPFSSDDKSQWKGVDLCLLTSHGPRSFGYALGYDRLLGDAELDLVHTHGLWMYPSIAARRWSKRNNHPLIISPRGMLDSWALKNSAWKKYIAGLLFEKKHLHHAACLHALCESEYQSIRDYGLTNPVAIIPNGVYLPNKQSTLLQPDWAIDLPRDCKVLLFLGRIHPKKGLLNLLNSWAHVREQLTTNAGPWRLVIAGWDQGSHQGELERLAKELGVDESVYFVGPQFDNNKAASLARADAFVLPSFSEGLPMSVLEAWSYSLPVLMTQECNLPEGFESQSALEMTPDTDSIAAALDRLFSMSEDDRLTMGEQGQKLVESRFNWKKVAAEMCAVYEWVLGRGPKPSCVTTD